MLNQNITFYKNALDNIGSPITVQAAIHLITSGRYDKQIQALRKVTDKDANANLKKKLPAVTWSGTFSKRNVKGLTEYSRIICIDIDKLTTDELLRIQALLRRDPFVMFMFISPNGNGLKVLITTTGTDADHAQLFLTLEQYFLDQYQITIDKSCKDVSRLCFLSSHAEAYLNENVEPFVYPVAIESVYDTTLDTEHYTAPAQPTTTDIMEQLFTFTQNKQSFVDGNKNNFVHIYCCNAIRHSIDKDRVFYYFETLGIPRENIKSTVDNTYRRNGADWGKYATAPLIKKTSIIPTKSLTATSGTVDDSVLFWEWQDTGKTKKEKKLISNRKWTEDFVDEDTGEVVSIERNDPIYEEKDVPQQRLTYSHDNALKFLNNNGFWKYRIGSEEDFVLIRVVDNKIKVLPFDGNSKLKGNVVKQFMLNFLESQPEDFKQIRELFRKNPIKYTGIDQLDQLPFYPTRVEKLDTATQGFMFFRNCYIKVTKDSIEKFDYSQLPGRVWSSQIIDHDYTDTGDEGGVIADFLHSAILGRKCHDDIKFSEIEIQKMIALWTSIGYLIHGYKDPTINKAVIATDGKLRKGNENNGGSGKTLLGVMASRIISTCDIDGKSYDEKDRFNLDLLNPDHRLLFFNDVKKTFQLEGIYNILTNTMTYRKLYSGSIAVPYKDSPKVYIATNYTIRHSAGSSAARRMATIEFSDYWNDSRRPIDVYGHRFFDDWDNAARPELKREWDRFYTFFVKCLQAFLKEGLKDFPSTNLAMNTLMDEASEDFIDWMEEQMELHLEKPMVNKKELFNAFLVAYPQFGKWLRPNKWHKWVTTYCAIHNIGINVGLGDESGHYKSNGKYYLKFTRIAAKNEGE